jgi:hypothetical protein
MSFFEGKTGRYAVKVCEVRDVTDKVEQEEGGRNAGSGGD